MMAKDSVKKRFSGEGDGMSFTEFTYQLVPVSYTHLPLGLRQLMAFAKMRAQVVFPTPRGPQKPATSANRAARSTRAAR